MFNVYAECQSFKECTDPAVVLKGLNLKYTTEKGLIGALIGDILPIVIGLAGFLTVIVIIISGIQFILSSGNPEAAGAARSRLTYALIGFVVIILSFVALQVVNSLFLGSGLTPK